MQGRWNSRVKTWAGEWMLSEESEEFYVAKSEGEDLEINLNGWGIGEFYKALGVRQHSPEVMEIAHGF